MSVIVGSIISSKIHRICKGHRYLCSSINNETITLLARKSGFAVNGGRFIEFEEEKRYIHVTKNKKPYYSPLSTITILNKRNASNSSKPLNDKGEKRKNTDVDRYQLTFT